MTSAYRRDHEPFPRNDEFERIATAGRTNITAAIDAFEALYPLPVAPQSETRALERAFARYLIDTGKASTAGLV
jgi:hypothetical protein